MTCLAAVACDGADVAPPPPPPPAAPLAAEVPSAVPKAPADPKAPAAPPSAEAPSGAAPAWPLPALGPDVAPPPPPPPGAAPPPGAEPPGAEPAAPDAAPPARRPLRAGQWTRHRVTTADGRTSQIEYRVVGEERGAHWIETDTEGLVMKMLLEVGDRPADVRLHAVRVRQPSGEVLTLEGPMLEGTRGMLAGLTEGWSSSAWGTDREDVTVPAGTFRGAFRGRHATRGGPVQAAGVAWHHPDVPLSGLVRSEDDDGGRMELVAFGETGARAKLP